ncbi:MAG: type I methionyl aminopeptidase [Candidatus Saccharimonadia bacterium]
MKPKTQNEIADMRISGKMLATVLDHLKRNVSAGISTKEIAQIAASELAKLGGQAPFLYFGGGRNIPPFPDVICISVNDEVVHGIPGNYVLKDGDIVGLDFGVSYHKMITDGAITIGIGKISAEASRLIRATKQALIAGISEVKADARVAQISSAIEQRLVKDRLGIVEELAGHGVGHALHEEPWIPNFNTGHLGPRLKSNMTIAIEPMATLGRKEVMWHRDGWTISTLDQSLSAHFEHTVLVCENGFEILTKI